MICLQVILKRMHKLVQTARNMHILFYEQAVCRRGTKNYKKAYLMMKSKMTLQFHGKSWLCFYCSKNRSKRGFFCNCHVIIYEVSNGLTHFPRKIIVSIQVHVFFEK